jgi:hypothetical protein
MSDVEKVQFAGSDTFSKMYKTKLNSEGRVATKKIMGMLVQKDSSAPILIMDT